MSGTERSKEARESAPVVPVDVLLRDGSIATVRPILPSDLAAVRALHEQVGDESLRLRFFSVNRQAADSYARHLCLDPHETGMFGLVALVGDRLLAVASAEPVEPAGAEVAFLVADTAHGLGLGTLLLEHLAAAARLRGVSHFIASVLVDNTAMLRVFIDAGFDLDRRNDHGIIEVRLDTAATARAVAAADDRESQAEARSLAPLLYPASVAIAGVRRDGAGVGQAVLQAVRDGGFAGDLYVVHPDAAGLADSLGDIPVLPSFAAIGRPVDLALVAVPAERVLDVVRDAAEAGTRAAAVLSSGFSEVGGPGRSRQAELVRIARGHSMRLVGPNCLGVIANDPAVRLNATFTRTRPPSGRLAVASQSGGVGIAMIDLARESGMGLASFVSLGNKADVSGNDLLAAWLEDDRVGAAALYLESFGNPRKFARVARRFSERKPLLAIVGGRSDSGARAGASHTAAAASPSVGIDALFAQAGVIACPGLTAMIDIANLLTSQPPVRGPRLAVVGNAGGLGVLAADAATAAGLVVPELSVELRDRIDALAPGNPTSGNPIDLGAAAGAPGLHATTTQLLGSDEVDAVLLIVAGTTAADPGACLPLLVEDRTHLRDKPLLLVAVGEVEVPEETQAFARFRSVEDAAQALARCATYAAWLAAPSGDASPASPVTTRRPRELLADARAANGSGWMHFDQARDLLAEYAVSVPGSLVRGAEAAVGEAALIGYPVVVKAAEPDIVHKTERGLVRTDLQSSDAVRRAVAAIAAELDDAEPRVVVQPQAEPGVEVAVGLVRDPGFGPLVMVAAGGIATDVWNDRVFLMPPLTSQDAARAVRSLRIWPLLAGFRNSPRVDVEGLEQLVLAVSRLALDIPEIAELDLNPVVVSPSACTCVDVKLRTADAPPEDTGVPRSLRQVRAVTVG